jgi:hypothetical protein
MRIIRGVGVGLMALAIVSLFVAPSYAQGKSTQTGKAKASEKPLAAQAAILLGSPGNQIRKDMLSVIPIVVFSSNKLDATQIAAETLIVHSAALGLSGANGKSPCLARDVNKDGLADLTCQIQMRGAAPRPAQTTLVVEGQTVSGTRFRAEVPLIILP